MASDVLLHNANSACPNSVSNNLTWLYNGGSRTNEPIYENNDILKDVGQPRPSRRSVTELYVPLQVPSKPNIAREENVYENADSIKKYIQSQNASVGIGKDPNGTDTLVSTPEMKDSLPESRQLYRSTLSMTIGRKEDGVCDHESLPANIPSRTSQDGVENAFKSSYAKSLIDSYQNKIRESHSLGISPKFNGEVHPDSLGEDSSSSYRDCSLPTTLTASPTVKHLDEERERFLSELYDKVNSKQEELSKVNKELFSLRLECNRLKAENKSLKVAQTIIHRVSPGSLSGGGSQPSSLTSLSGEVDVWTLQQQIQSLTAQLEKAELSRHAYESATRQLVYFLQTINSTLTALSSPEGKGGNHVAATTTVPLARTTDMIQQLEKTIRNSKRAIHRARGKSPPIYANVKDEDSSCSSTSNANNSLESEFSEKKPQFRLLIEDCSTPVPDKAEPEKPRPKANCHGRRSKDTLVKPSEGCPKERRFSLTHKMWLSAKSPICRSGSVNALSVQEKKHSPKVSRAASTQCISSPDCVDALAHDDPPEQDPSGAPTATPNRMLSTKAKGFFSSLKNIFKADAERAQDPSGTIRRKLTFPTLAKLGRLKGDPVTSLPSPSFCYKENKASSPGHTGDGCPEDVEQVPHEHSFQSSTFYISCPACSKEDAEKARCTPTTGSLESKPKVEEAYDGDQSEGFEMRDHQSGSFKMGSHQSEGFEISGPQEISVSLSLLEGKQEIANGYVENGFTEVSLKDSPEVTDT